MGGVKVIVKMLHLLYISLTEWDWIDSALMLGMVKQSSDEDWGGHAWAMVNSR